MSHHPQPQRSMRVGIALLAGLAFAVLPVAAQAATVDLGTSRSFVVLGGQSVTNTGPSVLNGDLGVSPGTSLTGFGAPAVVNGATHNNDAVAGQAQADLTTAYNVAAAEPGADMTGLDLGNRTLTPGAYRFTSSAQLTGPLTLNAEGNSTAQFVFEIGSALTTASASSVVLINGASPCNVYWQVGSSATLGSTTAFQGNLMALTSISLNNGASVRGRVLARNGGVSLINNVLDGRGCGVGSGSGSGPGSGPGSTPTGGSRSRRGTSTFRRSPNQRCTDGFSARVRGKQIKKVVFSIDGRRISSRARSPFKVYVKASPGRHTVSARVTYKDATRAKTLKMRYRACAAAVRQIRRGPSRLTG